MKMIRAILQPHRLDAVRDALAKLGIAGLTVFQAQGYGRQRGHKEIYRGSEYTVAFIPKIVLDAVVEDDKVESAIDAIVTVARTGQVGDGKIFVSSVEQVLRIRTGERDENAL